MTRRTAPPHPVPEPRNLQVLTLRIAGQQRVFLQPREIAEHVGLGYDRTLTLINTGVLHHAKQALGTAHYPVPVAELTKLAAVDLAPLDDVPRLLLPRTVAQLCGVNYDRVLTWIHEGLISDVGPALGSAYCRVPTTELCKLVGLAKPA